MDFPAPRPADLVDVESLNQAFLGCLRSTPAGAALRHKLPAQQRTTLRQLSDVQIKRLAGAPFLLLSLREYDTVYWQRLLTAEPGRDLFTPAPAARDPIVPIVTAALGYLWQLASRNPYNARIVSGAPLQLCEQLSASPLVTLLQRAADRTDMLELRRASDHTFWNRLLGPCLSSNADIRRAAHLCALQTVLADTDVRTYTKIRTAARSANTPTLKLPARHD
jgi:hypothetical protein